MKPDLCDIQRRLLELSRNCIRRFADEHRDERFYGFGFDLNTEYGDVLLSANTEAAFKETAEKYVRDWNYSNDELAGLKKNFGDWHYQGFNLCYSEWEENWKPCAESIELYVFDAETEDEQAEQFTIELVKVCSLVLLDLESSNIFDQLDQEPGFYIQLMDHGENEDDATERFERYRMEFNS